MLASAIIATVVSVTVSLFFVLGLSIQIDHLKREIEVLKAIIDHK